MCASRRRKADVRIRRRHELLSTSRIAVPPTSGDNLRSKVAAMGVRKRLPDCAARRDWRWIGATPIRRASDSFLRPNVPVWACAHGRTRSDGAGAACLVTGAHNGSARPLSGARSQAHGAQVLRQSRADAIHAQPQGSRSSPAPGRQRAEWQKSRRLQPLSCRCARRRNP